MSKSTNLPAINSTNISSINSNSMSINQHTSNTDNLHSFLDRKNSTIYVKSKISILRSKKSVLDGEIVKFNDIYQQNKSVKALELFNEMTAKHLTSLMSEFIDINQQILGLQSQLDSNLAHIESNLVN